MAIALRYEESNGSWALVPSVFGFAFGFAAVLLIFVIPINIYRESNQAKWPTAVATITSETVRKSYQRGGDVWQIETGVRYAIDGEKLTSLIRSRTGSYGEEQEMYRWASRHQPGTSLPIRYDPENHHTIVPDAGDMPETGTQVPGDLKMLLMFAALSAALITLGRVLNRRELKPV